MALHPHSLRPFRVGMAAAVKQAAPTSRSCRLRSAAFDASTPSLPSSDTYIASILGTALWGFPRTLDQQLLQNRTHVLHGPPSQLAVREIVPLRLQGLSPVNITKPAVVDFLQSQVKSRSAAQQSVQAVVLSGSYLPSQLEVMADMAAKQQIKASCFISSQQLHVLLARSPLLDISANADTSDQQQQEDPDWTLLLSGAFGNCLQPLPKERLQAAWATEDALNRQLRLFNGRAWNDALQLQLLSRKAGKPLLAIRSLMGPPALAAVRKLVDKHNLYLLEHERRLQQPFDDLAESSTSGSSTRSRRRPQAVGKASAAAQPPVQVKELVLVVSRVPLSAEDAAQLPPEFFTDYVYEDTGSAGGDSASSGNLLRWWAKLCSGALLREQ